LPSKLAGNIERVYVDFDFSNLFATGVTISNPELDINADPVPRVLTGNDLAFQDNAIIGTGENSMVVSQMYDMGIPGDYLLRCTVDGSDNTRQTIELILPVVSKRLG
jgi:hypothetical protein